MSHTFHTVMVALASYHITWSFAFCFAMWVHHLVIALQVHYLVLLQWELMDLCRSPIQEETIDGCGLKSTSGKVVVLMLG